MGTLIAEQRLGRPQTPGRNTLHENEQHRPGLDALVSDAGRRRERLLLPPSREEIAPPMEYTEIAAPAVSPPTRPRSARKRIVKTKMSDSEYRTFLARVKRSELSASEFLRRAALTERITISMHTELDIALLDELALLKANIGRVGGLLKMTIRPNEGQRTLHPAEWEELLHAARQAERMAKRLAELEVKIADGYC